ncbi:hypothetical protein ACI68E_003326 [Malassezia pachydermatis]|uniref:F-box domain-containing protein n=1 Tax=Malassezia pachydermatis TaxID=77020 RepID=A0A0M8MPQ3_9BASI|nr:hypothetical protein Malapachy_4122 [Malassezia pachydermatis]KOS14337.1 hypothetical protein Malapachy_4122 [Malassezia pachydermatis]
MRRANVTISASHTPTASSSRAPTGYYIPSEILQKIFSYALYLDQVTAVRLLQLNHVWRQVLQTSAYTRVELCSASALENFASLVRARPEVARAVRRLWIGPTHARSDFLSILSLPMPGDSAYLEKQREQVYNDTRFVLRACRRLEDIALSGSLVAADIVQSYGTACQPRCITSINPHSFISAFDAPMFRRVQELRVCDVNLSHSEVDAIRRMPVLQHFVHTTPKDYGDCSRDAHVLRKVVVEKDPLEGLAKMRIDDKPLRIGIRGVPARASATAQALQASLEEDKKHIDIYTETIPSTMVEEWEALRDIVFNAQGDYSRMALEDDTGAWVDPTNALQFLWHEWQARSA